MLARLEGGITIIISSGVDFKCKFYVTLAVSEKLASLRLQRSGRND